MPAEDATAPDELMVGGERQSTNAVDMDIAAIEDPDLRRRIAAAFERLRGRAEYGLVFEKHKPESVVLHGQPIREDRYATLREKSGPKNAFRVVAIDEDKATLQPVDEHFRPQGEPTSEAVDALVPLARFGDPIFPGLEQTGEVLGAVDEVGIPTKPFHTVINGENFHALETLLYAYEGKVDCIYIDPPYNTGAKDWKYNNDYVEREDVYRHSLWLSMMEKRLKVAQRLLNPDDSVLIVTIDEKEYLRLGLLLEQVFRGARIQMVTIVTNPNGVARGAELARVEEYAFFCFFGDAAPARVADALLGEQETTARAQKVRWEWLMRGGSNSRRIDRPNLFYPIYIDTEAKRIAKVGQAIPIDADTASVPDEPGLQTLWPTRANGTEANWRTSPEYLQELLDRGYAKLGAFDTKTGRWSVLYLGKAQIKRIERGDLTVTGRAPDGSVVVEMGDEGRRRFPKTVWNRPAHSAGEFGSRMLRALIPGRDFPFPKSLYAVEDSLRAVVEHKPDAVILDFFSGSGTTAHAVMRLNKQDGGHRRSISVTNNEVAVDEQKKLRKRGWQPGDLEWEALGICEYITKPRITSVITGKTPQGKAITGEYRFIQQFPMAEGFEENARFFNLTYLDPEAVEAKQSFAQIAHILWLIGGAEGPVIEKEPRSGWALPEGATYGVLFRNKGRAAFAEALKARTEAGNPPRHVFIVADSTDEFHRSLEEVGADPAHTTRLYRSYLKNFRTNVIDLKDEL